MIHTKGTKLTQSIKNHQNSQTLSKKFTKGIVWKVGSGMVVTSHLRPSGCHLHLQHIKTRHSCHVTITLFPPLLPAIYPNPSIIIEKRICEHPHKGKWVNVWEREPEHTWVLQKWSKWSKIYYPKMMSRSKSNIQGKSYSHWKFCAYYSVSNIRKYTLFWFCAFYSEVRK